LERINKVIRVLQERGELDITAKKLNSEQVSIIVKTENYEESITYRIKTVPEELIDPFWATVPRGFKHKHIMTAIARLWISLPEEYRKQLIDAESDLESKPGKAKDSLVEIMRKIAQDEFSRLHKSQKK